MWDRVEGQDRAVALLRQAAERPSHAYLLSGPPGSGVVDAARCFAASLLCDAGGCGECRHCTRVLRARHPDVVEVEPEGSEILVDQANDIIETAFRSPVEGERKVIVIHEADRMNEAAANKLLKTFEEPPDRTMFLLLTSAPDELLDTVRSRCQRVAFGALPAEAVRRQRLAGPLAGVVEVFGRVPQRLDGSGGAVAVTAADLVAAIDDALARVKDEQQREMEELDAELEQAGYTDRVSRRIKKTLATRHERVERRARTDVLAEGIAVLEASYRDALLGPSGVAPEAALGALDAIADARRKLAEGIVLNWGLMLEDLLLNLPGVPDAPGTLAPQLPQETQAPE